MIDKKDIKDYCKNCDVEPPAMRFKCPKCKHNPDKKEIKKYCSGIDYLTCDEVEPCIYRIANKLQEQLKRKEQECEELKQWKKGAESLFKAQIDNTDKIIIRYKQALDEIKEIAEENIRIADLEGLNGVYRRGLAEQILQKISEVLKDG